MASIISGFEYDIFISYRQKDNKHDGWVTKFADNLKGELEATFKEDVSVYFDENPHDRLQETHNVDKSLEGKLKCLIFIPILSQTYCDPNSYAWQYEFLTFLRMAENDRFGRNVKLRSGNIASRLLPIRIHDLDVEDVKVFEEETGSVLRAMDFVFKTSSGVNRPLKVNEDHPNDNLNKTFYSDQINKVANAIKDIISGLKSEPKVPLKEIPHNIEPLEPVISKNRFEKQNKTSESNKKKLLSGVVSIVVLIVILLAYQKIINTQKNKIHKDSGGKISIAVNTFDNLTGDTILNPWRMGISELLIYNLATSKELSVQNSQTMFEVYQSIGHTKNTSVVPSLSREAAMKLKAGTYISGNFQKAGNKIRIIVKLIDTNSDELLWTGKVDGNLSADYIDLADSLSQQLKDFLEISALEKNASLDFREAFTNSADAYRKFIEGTQLFMSGDYLTAIESLKEAYSIDSTFTLAAFYIANANNIIATDDSSHKYVIQAVKWTQKAYEGKERLPEDYQQWVDSWRAWYITKNSNDVLTHCALLEKSDIKSRYYWYDIGVTYLSGFKMWDKAVNMFEKIETTSSEWGEDWNYKDYYRYYGYASHQLGNHEKEAKIYETGLKLFPDNGYLVYGQAMCAIATGDTAKSKVLIDNLIKLGKVQGASARLIETWLGYLYQEANSLNKAEEHFRAAFKMNPDNFSSMNNLARFLIYYDRDIDEGMNLINAALKINPGNRYISWNKGIGCYKQGKYQEALSLLQQIKDSWVEINPELDKDIQKIKDAINNQK